jgi:formate hydrogenlyase subunit 3/multisubunit Na+/H+ antiporter MnhD subunit
VKAGVIPLHVWLPEAHAAAPSHVSALMSGAMVKLGLYGMLRLAVLLGPLPAAAGASLAALGLAGAWLGISLALQQRDLKRALAYSSIENLGLIALGLGLAAWGSARGNAALALFGLIGALLHVWNHAAMKGLLFLAAGAAVHAAGTRDLERLGGLLRRMPFTGACFVAGAVAISGLPPLNGFNSEWLLYRGLFGTALDASGVARVAVFLSTALLALIGGLAAACTVRLLGIAFLGEPRDRGANAAHEGGLWLRAPLALLLLACIALAVLPSAVVSLCGPVAREVLGPTAASADALSRTAGAVAPVGAVAAASWLALVLGWPLVSLLRGRSPARDATWGCGYAAPSARMQYTARSFSEQFAKHLLPHPLAPRVHASPVHGRFPASADFATEEGDPITRGGYEPIFRTIASRFARLRVLQQGNAHLYLTYIVVAVLASLLWTSLRTRWLP